MERATAAERLLWRRLLAMLRRVKVSRCYFNDHIYYCTESALTPVWDQGLQCCSTSATASLLFDLLPKNIRHTSNTFFPPTMCRWMTYSSYKQTSINTRFLCLIFDLCFYNCNTACEKLKWLRRWTEQAKTANWAFQVNSLHSPDKFSESCANLYSSCFWS